MSTEPNHHIPPDTVSHPSWCDPFRCTTIDGDVQHESHSRVMITREFELELTLVQPQRHDESEPGDTELHLEVVSTEGRQRAACGYLLLDELDSLLELAHTERERARWCSAPVVRPAVA